MKTACAVMFRKFSTPGGVPSHCGPHVPNSMHEGGELGYSLVHAFGAAFDNPDLIVACVIGDGESETCPLEGSWKGGQFSRSRGATARCCRFCTSMATRSRGQPRRGAPATQT